MAKEITNFNSTQFNTFVVKIGDSHSPNAAVWTSAGGTCYTTDETVVTVDENGKVTATGKGTAYVIIKAGAGELFEIYMYVVNG